jgi:hypothetical protein
MVYGGADTRPSTYSRNPDAECDGPLRPAIEHFNPLTSFVLHMMYRNCGNMKRPRRVGTHTVVDGRGSVREMDDFVRVIEEWEADGKCKHD